MSLRFPTSDVQALLAATSICSRCRQKAMSRAFSTTPQPSTRLRESMFRWLNGPGAAFRDPLPGSTNYLNAYHPTGYLIRTRNETGSDEESSSGEAAGNISQERNIASGQPIPKESADDLMPFPMNRQFRSQPVLSEELKDEVYAKISQEGWTVRKVSAYYGIEMRRVGAVFRLKSVEDQWLQEGKRLATPYARAVNSMLPKTPAPSNKKARPTPHESINDLPVHSATTTQLFQPVPESMHFNRASAAKVFDRDLLPAEDRIPHPELVELAKLEQEKRGREDLLEARQAELEKEEHATIIMQKQQKAAQEASATKAENSRWQFRFENIKVESVGKDGRAKDGVGARYGFPPQDRKKGQIKIPTRVE
ncbi:MAG: hypothetical protein Q9219_002433 [cf. Caloplaca sp. 3 TL-2023]